MRKNRNLTQPEEPVKIRERSPGSLLSDQGVRILPPNRCPESVGMTVRIQRRKRFFMPRHRIKQEMHVEQGIPIPKYDVDIPSKYPFASMNVGDSFFVKYDGRITPGRLKKLILNNAYYYRRRVNFNIRFIVKRVEKGVRCWRTM